MKYLMLPLVLGALAAVSHAAPSPLQPQARQAPTTLSVSFYGASDTIPDFEVDVFLPEDEEFYPFNISESPFRPLACFPHSDNELPYLYLIRIPTCLTSIAANPASISRICVGGPGFCGVTGAEGSSTLVNGGYCKDVGPPQPQVSGVCSTF